MAAPRLICQFASAFAIVCCWLSGVTPGAADSAIGGKVTDRITQQPIVGADVQIEYSGQIVGAGTSEPNGVYRVFFAIPPGAPANLTMTASFRSEGYAVTKSPFQVSPGNAGPIVRDIALFPTGVANCLSQRSPAVIVGHFLPPLGRDFADLSARIARTLEYALNTRLQTVRLILKLQPSFEPSDAANPRIPVLGAKFAKALGADAFVSGEIAPGDGSSDFTVSVFVSDAYDLFSTPATASNRSIDLSSPSAGASITGETHAAVLASIAAGLANKKNDCRTAMDVLLVAEQLVEVTPAYITRLRETCNSRNPNAGLRRATP